MNWDVIKWNWDQATGKMKEMWWDLTEDELKEMEWSAEAMSGKIQEKFGKTKAEADAEVEKLSNALSD